MELTKKLNQRKSFDIMGTTSDVKAKTMKAIVQKNYGSFEVFKMTEAVKPVPRENEVLIRVRASSFNAGDCHLMSGTPYLLRLMGNGLLKPLNSIPGQDVSGIVEVVGKSVKKFQKGDEVFGQLKSGSFAQFVCTTEANIEIKPQNLTLEQAATVPISMLAALQGLNKGGMVHRGEKILINGASGGVGTFAVQIAKAYGAEVFATCSTKNIALVKSIGVDHVIDYTKKDFTKDESQYDLILDLVGNHRLSSYKHSLKREGRLVVATSGAGNWFKPLIHILKMMLISLVSSQKMIPLISTPNENDLTVMLDLLKTGKIIPVIQKRYKLNEVPEAARLQSEGHVTGKSVIII